MPRPPAIGLLVAVLLAATWLTTAPAAGQASVSPWWKGYSGEQADGPEVLGYWKFDGDGEAFLRDSSSHAHRGTLRGAKWHAEGRFGGCLESAAGYPLSDDSHALHVARSPVLSPRGPFTLEMWIRPKPAVQFPAELAPTLLDMKYVPTNHTGMMLSLTAATGEGHRRLAVEIGLGADSQRWYSEPIELAADRWQHIAFTYDAAGAVAFIVNGAPLSRSVKPSAGPMAAATRQLSIGDRSGSLYRGFPGYVDEVRLTAGMRDFSPLRLEPSAERLVLVRMAPGARLKATLINQTGAALREASITAQLPGGAAQTVELTGAADDTTQEISLPLDTSLKPGRYEAAITAELPQWEGAEEGYRTTARVGVVIVPRPLPHRMPVVMWGINGTDNVIREIPRLKEIGFTHCLGLRADYSKIWQEGAEALPGTAEEIAAGRAMLDAALENDIRIVATLSPARWLRDAAAGKPYLRVDRQGTPYERHDVSGLFPEVQQFCFNTGAAVGRAYGDHPALAAALVHTEVRGESQVSFHPLELEAYRKATGEEVPDAVTIKNGVQYEKLDGFPADRVIADDHPILQYLRWFWREGDGWNQLNTRLHEGLHEHVRHDGFWTFHDPAVRVPSIGGSGGKVDVLSHWTYSYPDPIRIGLCADELLEMARANGHNQRVMKMTQLIWYRSQTAPPDATAASAGASPWVDQDPDAAYITIAPMHLREALWWKLSRPIQGIMYHGWQSLVETDSPSGYRYTNPNTRHELRRLIGEVVEPLGPTLVQVPDVPADVAMLESFTSQMYARRGTYGWNRSWAGDMYHVLMYAQLQPRVLYEESLLDGGLQGIKVLVLADCDVLPESVVATIRQFQASGGLVVGDAEVCPALEPDLVVPRTTRTKDAKADREKLLSAAAQLRAWLQGKYEFPLASSTSDVVTRRRRFGTTDYLFAVNDRREAGSYVGQYGMVMEDGLPTQAELQLAAGRGHVYDLVAHREVPAASSDQGLRIPLELGPCEGRLLMVSQRPIERVHLAVPDSAAPGEQVEVHIAVTDGDAPIDAVAPVEVRIVDPEGVEAEFSGYYGAAGGELRIAFDFAANDRRGLWQVRVRELASGKSAVAYVRLVAE